MKEVLKIENLTKTYIKSKRKFCVLNNINYNFNSNTFYCINGKSGAGKTTLIEILGLLKNYENGKLIINGKDTSELSEKEKAIIRNQKIGFVFQSFYLIPTMTALENVMLPLYVNKKINKKEIKLKALELLNNMNLKDRCNHFPKELSGGEQQRVAIARALINNPTIILADEPTGSLDPENETKILKILKKLSDDGKCVIVVSHSNEILKYADKVLKIKDGELI